MSAGKQLPSLPTPPGPAPPCSRAVALGKEAGPLHLGQGRGPDHP